MSVFLSNLHDQFFCCSVCTHWWFVQSSYLCCRCDPAYTASAREKGSSLWCSRCDPASTDNDLANTTRWVHKWCGRCGSCLQPI